MNDHQRKLNAFLYLYDTSFGTLWWCKNYLWAQDKSFVIPQGKENGYHPGVSIQKSPPPNNGIVPMLLGTSKKPFSKSAVSLKMNDDEDKFGYFGSLRPVNFSFVSFLNGDITIAKEKKLSDVEQKKLHDFIKRKLAWKIK